MLFITMKVVHTAYLNIRVWFMHSIKGTANIRYLRNAGSISVKHLLLFTADPKSITTGNDSVKCILHKIASV